MKKVIFSIVLVCAASLITILAAPPNSVKCGTLRSHRDEFIKEEFDFYPVNPEKVYYHEERLWRQFPTEEYIWTPKIVFCTTDRIPMYMETWYSPNRRNVSWRPGEMVEFSPPFVETFAPPPLNWTAEIGPSPRLLIRRAPFNKRIKVLLKEYEEGPKHPFHVYFPNPERIPCHWLHGTPTKYSKRLGNYVEVELNPGKSFVQHVPNLLDYWYLRKDSCGRIYVKCAIPAPRTFKGYREVWLPIEGRYRVQYGTSNIIEFEIRQ